MGQRLCITIKRKGKPVANSYYHWSGYTFSAMNLLERVYSYLSDHINDPDKKLVAIRALEYTGAGLEKYNGETSDYDLLKMIPKYKDVDFTISTDRNDGYIACFSQSMQGLDDASEEYCDIDMDTLIISFRVLCYYADLDEVKEYYEELDVSSIPEIDASPEECDIGTLRDILNAIDKDSIVKCSNGYFGEIG